MDDKLEIISNYFKNSSNSFKLTNLIREMKTNQHFSWFKTIVVSAS
jgi:hypothetical protein